MQFIGKLLCALIVLLSPASLGCAEENLVTDLQYLKALQTVNVFLYSWIRRDERIGMELISTKLIKEIPDKSWISQFIVGLSNPHHQAFEIGKGRKSINGNGYIFPVVCYELSDVMAEGIGYVSEIEVVKEKDGFRLSKLPKSSDNP